MSDNPWLRELAQVNREKEAEERNRLEERWDRLSSGDLSPEEEAELRAMAETSEEAGEAYEAFRPLGPEFHASVVHAIRAQGLAEEAGGAKPPAKLLPFPIFRFAGWSAAAAAAAAVLVLFLRPSAPLPDYSMEVSGGSRATRGEEPEEMVTDFAPGDRFQVILRPQTAASGLKRLEALAFLSQGEELRRLDVQSELDPGGAVKMEGSLDRDLRPGIWTLWSIVGRRGKLPDPADLAPLAARAAIRQRDWIVLPAEIHIHPRSP